MPIDRATIIDDTGLGDNGTIADAAFMTALYDAIDRVAGPGLNWQAFPYLAVPGAADNTTAIQAAITAGAALGETVYGPPGTWIVTNLTGLSNVTIRGAGMGVTTLKRKANTAGNFSILDFDARSKFRVCDITLDGNKANQTAAASNITIGTGSYQWTLDHVESINAKAVSGGFGNGIVVADGGNDTNFTMSRILYCQSNSNDGAGIFLNKEHFIEVHGNTCKSNGSGGVYVINYVFPPVAGVQQYISISNNLCKSNGGSGINVTGFYEGGSSSAPIYGHGVPPTKYVSITDNWAVSNTVYGIVYGSAFGVVSGNHCVSNGSAGSGAGFLFNAYRSTLSDNTTYDNGFYGVDAGASSESVIAHNRFVFDGVTSGGGRGINIGASQNMTVSDNMISMGGSTGTYAGLEASGVDGSGVAGDPFPTLGTQLIIHHNQIQSNGIAGTVGIFLRWQMGQVTVTDNLCTNFASNHEAYIFGVSDVVQHGNQDARSHGLFGSPVWQLASAATLIVPDFGEHFLVTGTTTITNIRTYSANIHAGAVRHVTITTRGSGYVQASPPTVTFTGGGGVNAAGTVQISAAGEVIGIFMTNLGSGYTSAPGVTFSSGAAAGTAIVGCNNFEGRRISLTFTDALTVTDGGNLAIVGNLDTVANESALELVGHLAGWVEQDRSGPAVKAWTPTDASGAALSLTNNGSYYVREGRRVSVTLDVTYPSTADGSAAKIVLPFTAHSLAFGALSLGYNNGGGVTQLLVRNNTTTLELYAAGAARTNANMSTTNMVAHGSYITT